MTMLRFLPLTVAGLLLALSSPAALAAAVVATAGNGKTYVVLDDQDFERAKADALEGCRQLGTNCRITMSTGEAEAIALAIAPNGSGQAIRKDPEQARDAALAECRKLHQGCRFAALFWERGGTWAALSVAMTAKGTPVLEHFAHHHLSRAAAYDDALARCQADIKGRPELRCKTATHWGKLVYALARSGNAYGAHQGLSREEVETEALRACRHAAGAGAACRIVQLVENPGRSEQPASFARIVAQTSQEQEKGLAAGNKAEPSR